MVFYSVLGLSIEKNEAMFNYDLGKASKPKWKVSPLHLPLATGQPEKTMFSGVSFVLSTKE